jgi:hypothetical protein
LLTSDTGNPHLDKQTVATTTIMKVSDDQADFEDNFDKAYAPYYQYKLVLKISESGLPN